MMSVSALISSGTMMMLATMKQESMTFPTSVRGMKSPYPMVVSVTNENHIALPNENPAASSGGMPPLK